MQIFYCSGRRCCLTWDGKIWKTNIWETTKLLEEWLLTLRFGRREIKIGFDANHLIQKRNSMFVLQNLFCSILNFKRSPQCYLGSQLWCKQSHASMPRVPQVPDLLTQSGPNVALIGANEAGSIKLESLILDTTWRRCKVYRIRAGLTWNHDSFNRCQNGSFCFSVETLASSKPPSRRPLLKSQI